MVHSLINKIHLTSFSLATFILFVEFTGRIFDKSFTNLSSCNWSRFFSSCAWAQAGDGRTIIVEFELTFSAAILRLSPSVYLEFT